MKTLTYLFLATGGTGGHVFPALAVAEELQFNTCKVGISFDQRCGHLFPQNFTPAKQLVLYNTLKSENITSWIKNLIYFSFNCYKVLSHFIRKKPQAILAFGSYAVLPVLLAAVILRVPIFLHEQNTVLGRVNSLFSSVAKKLFLSFRIQSGPLKGSIVSGLPIRKEILNIQRKFKSAKSQIFKLTVIGGSQGAAIFCKIIPKAISLLPSKYWTKIELCMQIQSKFYSDISKILKKTKCTYKLEPFIHNIADVYDNSDLIITRAGASSLAEICTVKQAAIIIPLPSAKDNHQFLNAQEIISESSLILREQSHFTEIWLRDTLIEFIDNNKKVTQINNSFKAVHMIHSEAVAKIIQIITHTIS